MLNRPNFFTWGFATIGGAFGIAIKLGIIAIPALAGAAFWIVAGAFALLVIACIIPGL